MVTHHIRCGLALKAAAAALSLTALAACSSSATSSSSSPAVTGSAATGSPILLGSMASLTNPAYSTPQVRDGIQAAIDSINAAGGVGGHPLKLDFCDTAFSVNGELTCTRKLIADKVDAFINPAVLADPSGAEYKLITAANIPVIGTEGQSPSELNTPVVFPLSSGIPGWFYGAVDALVQAGSKKISLFVAAGGTGQFLGGLATDALKSAGLTPATTVVENPAADPTFDSAAAKAIAGGVDGIVLGVSQADIPAIVSALRNAGYSGKISSITALFGPAALQALGSKADGILLASQLAFVSDTSNQGIASFLADMKKYVPKATVDETTEFSWSATQLFAKVAIQGKAYTSADLLSAMNSLSAPVDIGTAAPYTTTGTSPLASTYPRILNPTVQFGVIKGGQLVSSGGGFENPFTQLSQNTSG